MPVSLQEAESLMARGDLEGAALHLVAYNTENPDDFEAMNKLGVCLARMGRSDDAMQAFELVLL